MGDINAKKCQTISRENCLARMKIKRNNDGKWVVTEFKNKHTHGKVTPSKVDGIRSHKRILTDAKRMIDTMQEIGMRACTITSILK